MARLREAEPSDAAALLTLKRSLDRETRFMLIEPDERTETAEDVATELGRIAETGNAVILLAEADDEVIGYVEAVGGRYRRARGTAYVVIGVLARMSGRGIGGALLDALEHWARRSGIHRLELTVMEQNDRAIRLYERRGFLPEGRRRACLSVDGAVVDEIYMGKLI